MTAFIIRRLLISVVLLFFISLISFFIITLTPGSPYPWGELNPKVSEDVKRIFREKFHLDRPLHEQYGFIMRDLFTGELRSIKDERPVLQKIAERLPATLVLNLGAIALSLSFGLMLGIYGARYAGRPPDVITSILAFVFIALPGFWVSYLLAIGLVSYAAVPILGTHTIGVTFANGLEVFLDRWWHVMLPASILAIGGIAVAMVFNQNRLAPAVMRASLVVLFLFTDLFALLCLFGMSSLGIVPASMQDITGPTAFWSAAWLPAMLLGIWLGHRQSDRISPERFRRGVQILLVLIALLMGLRVVTA